MSGQDFSDDITNGGFETHAEQGDEDMLTGAGDECGDDSMGASNTPGGGGEGDRDSNSNRNGDMEGGHGGHHQGNGDSNAANNPGATSDQKLFIGGLSWETTEKDLREYFSKFGAIESLTLKMDPTTGRSRGFAFIVFSDPATLDKVIEAGEHVINGKKVDPKRAKARQGKIFVGGLTQDITDDEIKSYFQQFGNVVEMEMPIDKVKNQRKGFCFITFDNEQIVQELLKTPKQMIGGKEVDVKKAQPPQNPRMGMGGGGWGMGGGGGMGGGRGGRGAPRGRGGRGRGDWGWSGYGGGQGGSGYGGYGQGYGGYGSGYGDYYGGGYGNYYGDYSSYGYDSYSGYGDYDGSGTTSTRGGGGVGGGASGGVGGGGGGRGGRGTGGGFAGKTRGAPRGQPRHMPY